MTVKRIVFLTAIVFLGIAVMCYGKYFQIKNSNQYWTPANMAKSLDETSKYLKVYIQGNEIEHLVDSGQIVLKKRQGDSEVYSPVKREDITIRKNYKLKYLKDQLALAAGFGGIALGLLLSGLICSLRKRAEKKKD